MSRLRGRGIGTPDLFAGSAWAQGAVCTCCGRELSNPASVEAHMGPICRGKDHAKDHAKDHPKEQPEMHRARYTTRLKDGVIVLEDLDQGRSVTNDAELVIRDLAERGFDLSLPIIYRDTLGCWSGLLVRDGAFAGFLPLRGSGQYGHAATEAEARAALGKAVRGC